MRNEYKTREPKSSSSLYAGKPRTGPSSIMMFYSFSHTFLFFTLAKDQKTRKTGKQNFWETACSFHRCAANAGEKLALPSD